MQLIIRDKKSAKLILTFFWLTPNLIKRETYYGPSGKNQFVLSVKLIVELFSRNYSFRVIRESINFYRNSIGRRDNRKINNPSFPTLEINCVICVNALMSRFLNSRLQDALKC